MLVRVDDHLAITEIDRSRKCNRINPLYNLENILCYAWIIIICIVQCSKFVSLAALSSLSNFPKTFQTDKFQDNRKAGLKKPRYISHLSLKAKQTRWREILVVVVSEKYPPVITPPPVLKIVRRYLIQARTKGIKGQRPCFMCDNVQQLYSGLSSLSYRFWHSGCAHTRTGVALTHRLFCSCSCYFNACCLSGSLGVFVSAPLTLTDMRWKQHLPISFVPRKGGGRWKRIWHRERSMKPNWTSPTKM